MSKKSGFHRQIWPKSVTHLHGITLNHGFSINVEEPSWERKVTGLFDRQEALTMRAFTTFSTGEQVCFFTYLGFNKSRSCIDEILKDSAEKVQFTKNDKIQEATNESEEMLKMQKDTSNQMHYETNFAKKHDIKRKLHRQEKWKNTHGIGENKKNPATSLISSNKKDRKMLNTVQVGLKRTVHY